MRLLQNSCGRHGVRPSIVGNSSYCFSGGSGSVPTVLEGVVQNAPTNAAIRFALGMALINLAFMAPLIAQEAALPALAYQTSAEARAFSNRLARLDASGQNANRLQPETLEYRIRSRGVEGGMIDSITFTNLYGRQVLRVSRKINIAGKHQEEVSDLEPGSLLPIRHTRRINEPYDTIREDTAFWDHAGLRFFCEGNRLLDGRVIRQLYRKEWRLGMDLPVNAMDGLTAFIRFRNNALDGLTSLRVPVIEGSDERFECVFSEIVDLEKNNKPAAGLPPVITVTQHMYPESKGLPTAVKIELAESNAIPQRIEGEFFGMTATLDMVRWSAP